MYRRYNYGYLGPSALDIVDITAGLISAYMYDHPWSQASIRVMPTTSLESAYDYIVEELELDSFLGYCPYDMVITLDKIEAELVSRGCMLRRRYTSLLYRGARPEGYVVREVHRESNIVQQVQAPPPPTPPALPAPPVQAAVQEVRHVIQHEYGAVPNPPQVNLMQGTPAPQVKVNLITGGDLRDRSESRRRHVRRIKSYSSSDDERDQNRRRGGSRDRSRDRRRQHSREIQRYRSRDRSRDRRGDRNRRTSRDRSRDRSRNRSKNRTRQRSKSRGKSRDRDRSRDRSRKRNRSHSREQTRNRSRDRSRDRIQTRIRDRSRDAYQVRERIADRTRDTYRNRERIEDRTRDTGRERECIEDRTRDAYHERDRARDRSRGTTRARSCSRQGDGKSGARDKGEEKRNYDTRIDGTKQGYKDSTRTYGSRDERTKRRSPPPTRRNPTRRHDDRPISEEEEQATKKWNPYDALGIKNGKETSFSEIKIIYNRLARKYHPDVTGKSKDEQKRATDRMSEINKAWNILKDDRRRKAFDEAGITSDFDFEEWEKEQRSKVGLVPFRKKRG